MENKGASVILIVDDKPANILVLEHLLAGPDRELLRAVNGEEALRITFEQKVDLIILDVQMPGLDGFEVAQILQTNKRTRDIPIIFATAESKDYKFIMKGYDEGAIDYLFKPLQPEIVKAKVRVLLKIKKQQNELIEKNKALQQSDLLISNCADIIGIIDAATLKIEQVNPAFTSLLGYAEDKIKGKAIDHFLTTQDMSMIHDTKGKEQFSFETRISGLDGRIKWLQWKVVVRYGKWFFNAGDITAKKEAEEQIKRLNEELMVNIGQLESMNKELESFSYSVSHDLRAPLRGLNGYSTMLEEDYGNILDDEGKRLLERIQHNAQKMGVLIDDLLAFSRLGRKELIKGEVDIENLVKEVIHELIDESSERISIHVNRLESVFADSSLLKQVLVNLISNAIKYSSKKARAEITVGSISSTVETVFFVKDNGTGFNMKYADKLFGVFQRLHNRTEYEGTGIGLAIVQRIISKHGGRVWAEAKENKGATFYFSLPKIFHFQS